MPAKDTADASAAGAIALRNDSAYRQTAAAEEGSDGFTMFVRVNGEAIYARGANMVALDQLEGCEKRFLAPFYTQSLKIRQDRLGTNMRKR